MAGSIADMLHAAYSAIRGVEQNRSMAPITLDHLLKEHIESIKGGSSRFVVLASTGTRDQASTKISKLEQLASIQRSVNKVVDAVSKAGSDKAKLRELGLDDVGQGSAT